jgi:tetratricopeptide (TPR) repeat protein
MRNCWLTQAQIAEALKPNKADKYVQPQELLDFLNKQPGIKSIQRENGTVDLLRSLLSNGIPVIIQQWLDTEDTVAHYRVLRGFDNARNILIFNDSLADHPSVEVSPEAQDRLWKAWDRRYFPVFTAQNEALVMAILGADANAAENFSQALDAAEQYSLKNPADADAWRNLGYLRYAGNECKEAMAAWNKLSFLLKAGVEGPYSKFLWYQLWPVECSNRLGNYSQALQLVKPALDSAKVYGEARYEKAVALLGMGRKAEAIPELKLALLDDPNYAAARDLLDRLGG